MIVLTLSEVLNWLDLHSIKIEHNNLIEDCYKKIKDFILPKDSGHKTAIAKGLARIFSNNDCLFWINEYGI